MVTPIDAGLVVAGLLLAFVGAGVSVYAVTLTGFILGAGGGLVLSPHLLAFVSPDGLLAIVGTTVVGGVIGAFLAYTGLSFAVLGIGTILGGILGRYAVGPMYADGTILLAGMTLVGIAFGALIGFVLTRTTLVFSTGLIGAALASRQLTVADFSVAREAGSIDPLLFDATAPLYLLVFVLGVLSQFGLFKFGYVTKLAVLIPGARRWTASNEAS